MKKVLIICAAAFALASCNNEGKMTQTFGVNMLNLVTSPDGSAYASSGTYTMLVDYNATTIATEVKDITFGTGKLEFSVPASTYKGTVFSNGLSKFVYSCGKANVTGAALEVEDFNAMFTDAMFCNCRLDGYIPQVARTALVANYNVDGKRVRTFPQTALYGGQSRFRPETGADVVSETVYVNADISMLAGKMEIKVMNLKLEPTALPVQIIVTGVPMKFSGSGYIAEGQNLNASFSGKEMKASKVSFQTLNDALTLISLELEVPGKGMFSFQGSYLIEKQEM